MKRNYRIRPLLFICIGSGIVIPILSFFLPIEGFDILISVVCLSGFILFIIEILTLRKIVWIRLSLMIFITSLFAFILHVSLAGSVLIHGTISRSTIVQVFGRIVTGRYDTAGFVLGITLFVILATIAFLVIARGAKRSVMVAARFTLDSLPGRNMAIEADCRTGKITEDKAIRKKQDLQREVDYYGGIDGAVRFLAKLLIIGSSLLVVAFTPRVIQSITVDQDDRMTAIQTYISLLIGSELAFLFSMLLVSAPAIVAVTKVVAVGTNKRNGKS